MNLGSPLPGREALHWSALVAGTLVAHWRARAARPAAQTCLRDPAARDAILAHRRGGGVFLNSCAWQMGATLSVLSWPGERRAPLRRPLPGAGGLQAQAWIPAPDAWAIVRELASWHGRGGPGPFLYDDLGSPGLIGAGALTASWMHWGPVAAPGPDGLHWWDGPLPARPLDALDDLPLPRAGWGVSDSDASEGGDTRCPSTASGPAATSLDSDAGGSGIGSVAQEDGGAVMCDDGLPYFRQYLDDAVLSGTCNNLDLHFYLVSTRGGGITPRQAAFWAGPGAADAAGLEIYETYEEVD